MGQEDFLAGKFSQALGYAPTAGQTALFRDTAHFLSSDDGDILVVNGYAGTGKTTALSAVVSVMTGLKIACVLLAPTGRSAKVLSEHSGRPAFTIHKHIYRQKSFGENGGGLFTLSQNKSRNALFIVDEVSLIGIDNLQSNLAFGTGNLLEDLIKFVRSGVGCRLIMVGDGAQLPPVGLDKSPALSPEYMSVAGGVKFCTLEDVVRQKKESGILYNATLIREKIVSNPYSDILPEDMALKVNGFEDVLRIGGGELIDSLTDAYGKYGEDEVMVLCRSNKRANRYNAGIRAQVRYNEEQLVRDEKLMIVKNCYQFVSEAEGLDYIANGDMARLVKISHFEERYGLHFADAVLSFPDYGGVELRAKVCLDALESESAALTPEQQTALYQGVLADYSSISTKKKRQEAVREDPFYNALQLKYAAAITCHKSQGGQWKCVFIDNPFWQDSLSIDDLKWLYTAITRAEEKVYLVNFKDNLFV